MNHVRRWSATQLWGGGQRVSDTETKPKVPPEEGTAATAAAKLAVFCQRGAEASEQVC